MASAEPIDNRFFVLILQHPQERKEPLATAAVTRAMLNRAELVVGLSWPNLSRAVGRSVDPKRWAVLYLGSVRPAAFGDQREVIALDRRGEPAADQEAILRGLDGVVVLDGTWKEAKTLWWRNPWLLKLRRLVLNPQRKSRYGRIRREPRREALSTLEAVLNSRGATMVQSDGIIRVMALRKDGKSNASPPLAAGAASRADPTRGPTKPALRIIRTLTPNTCNTRV